MSFFTRLFRGSSQGYSQEFEAVYEELQRLQKAHKSLEAETIRAHERLDEVHSEHRKLRGRFYASRGELEPVRESKADILKRIGYIPGQPAPHR